MKQPQVFNIMNLYTPRIFYNYWFNYGRCLACKEPIRHELHLHNHWKKYHSQVIKKVWVYYPAILYGNEYAGWREISKNWIPTAKHLGYCIAIEKE